MFTVVIAEKEGAERRVTFAETEVTVGRVPGNDVVLPKGNVSKRHSRIVLKDNRFIVVDLKSTNGTYVNGRKITSPLVVKEGDKIYVGDYVLTLEGAPALDALQAPSAIPVHTLHDGTPESRSHGDDSRGSVPLGALRAQRDPMRETHGDPSRDVHNDSHALPSVLADDIPAVLRGGSIPPAAIAAGRLVVEPESQDDEPGDEADAILAAESELEVFEDRSSREQERPASEELPSVQVFPPPLEGRAPAPRIPDALSPQGIAREGMPLSLGPLDALLADPAVIHVVVERFDRIRVDRGLGLELEPSRFATPEALVGLASEVGLHASVPSDAASYDVSLANGLQVIAVLPAAASNGAVMSVRRRPRQALSLTELEQEQRISAPVRARIEQALLEGHVWVVGHAGVDLAGFMSATLGACPRDERVVLFERAPELALGERAAICLKHGSVPMTELLERVSAFRPDRLAFHGLRESELTPLLETLAQRSERYLASFSARSAKDALAALDRSVGPDLTLRAVSLLVELERDAAGETRAVAAYDIELDGSGELSLKE
jgi:pilus assembly protein CpaF